MPGYKLCVLSAGGDLSDCYDLVGCADDAHAIRACSSRACGRAMELWQQDRLVHRFPAIQRSFARPMRLSIVAPKGGI
jgi:hypothetical protein